MSASKSPGSSRGGYDVQGHLQLKQVLCSTAPAIASAAHAVS
jgi:hypothetical protein